MPPSRSGAPPTPGIRIKRGSTRHLTHLPRSPPTHSYSSPSPRSTLNTTPLGAYHTKMPSSSSYTLNTNPSECYCAPCDLYFSSLAQRAEHIQASPKHPECDYCKRRYLNRNTLRNHYIYSKHHHYCASCEIEFKTPAGLRYHIEHAPVHCADSDDEEEYHSHSHNLNSPEFSWTEWEEEMGILTYPPSAFENDQEEEEDDDSWEAYDDYDYEDAEELGVQESEDGDSSDSESEDETEEDEGEGDDAPPFACPMCHTTPHSVACAPCGHLFCSPCITNALKHTSACPVCSEAGKVEQLRKIFLA